MKIVGMAMVALGTMALVSGCAVVPRPVSPPPPVAAAVAAPPQALEENAVAPIEGYRVVRSYLGPGSTFVPGGGELPNGVLLLRPGDTATNATICNAFVANLPTETEFRLADPAAKLISTFWLLKTAPGGVAPNDCTALLANYDFARALDDRARYGLASSNGPLLLYVQDGGRFIAVDLGQVPAAQLGTVMNGWFGSIVQSGIATQTAPSAAAGGFQISAIAPLQGTTATHAGPAGGGIGTGTGTGPGVGDIACTIVGHAQQGGSIIAIVADIAGALFCPARQES